MVQIFVRSSSISSSFHILFLPHVLQAILLKVERRDLPWLRAEACVLLVSLENVGPSFSSDNLVLLLCDADKLPRGCHGGGHRVRGRRDGAPIVSLRAMMLRYWVESVGKIGEMGGRGGGMCRCAPPLLLTSSSLSSSSSLDLRKSGMSSSAVLSSSSLSLSESM